MLENLNEINWNQLTHMFGHANNIPGLLRDLASSDLKLRSDALAYLGDYLCHQGSIPEATAYATPFLIELLQIEDVQDKDKILSLLMAFDSSFYHSESQPPFSIWEEAAHRAVVEGLPIYLALLDHASPQVIIAAVRMLSHPDRFRVHHKTIVYAFQRHWQHNDPTVKATFLWGLGELVAAIRRDFSDDDLTSYRQFFQAAEADSYPRLVRLAAAFSTVKLLVGELSNTTSRILVDAVVNPLFSDQKWAHSGNRKPIRLPWSDELMDFAAIHVLCLVDIQQSGPVFAELLRLIDKSVDARLVAVTLLDKALKNTLSRVSDYMGRVVTKPDGTRVRVFPKSNEVIAIDNLSDVERQAIRAVLYAKAVWDLPSNLLEMYGLPASPDEMRDLLNSEEKKGK